MLRQSARLSGTDMVGITELFGLTGFNPEYMEIVYEDAEGTAKTGETNAGEYKTCTCEYSSLSIQPSTMNLSLATLTGISC